MVIGKIRAMNESGNTLYNVTIDALWTLPDGSSVSQTENYGDGKFSRFEIPASLPGTYTLSVSGVSKMGYQYAPERNIEESRNFLVE